jgi:MFS family permease
MTLAMGLWACSTGLWPLVAFALASGGLYGGLVALLPALVMDDFGGRHVSGIIGVLYTSVAVGTLIGPGAAGFAFDRSHSYTIAILASAGANAIAAVIVAATGARTTSTVPAMQ